MRAYVINFRRGRHTQYNNQIIIKIDGIDDKDKASGLVGKKVVWVSPFKKKIYIGTIVDTHGNKGQLRVRFRKGLPGQILGDIVFVIDNTEQIKLLQERLKEAKDPNQVRKIAVSVLS